MRKNSRMFIQNWEAFSKLIFILIFINKLSSNSIKKESNQEEEVVLTQNSISQFLLNNKYVVVQFYVPWSELCRKFKPAFKQLIELGKSSKLNVVFAKVDLSEENELAIKYEIRSYPSLVFFHHGEPIYRELIFNPKELWKWINRKVIISINELTDYSEINDIANRKFSVLLSMENYNKPLFYQYNALAANYEQYIFYYTFRKIPESSYHQENKQIMVVYRNFDDGKKILEIPERNSTFVGLRNFFERVHNPSVISLNQKILDEFGQNRNEMVLILRNKREHELPAFFQEVAGERRQEIRFFKTRVTSTEGREIAQRCSISDTEANAIFILKFFAHGYVKYKLQNFSRQGLSQFIDDYFNERLVAYYRSEPVPRTSDRLVKTIVGDNFHTLVINSKKFVLINIYAPGSKCGNCYQVNLMFDQLAEVLKNESDIFVGGINILANEHPLIQIRGLPTLRFYDRYDKKKFEDYEGDFTITSVIEFLEHQLDRDLSIPKLYDKEAELDL